MKMSELYTRAIKLYPDRYVSVSCEIDRHVSGVVYTYCRLYVQDAPTFQIEASTFAGVWERLGTPARGDHQSLSEVDIETVKGKEPEEEQHE